MYRMLERCEIAPTDRSELPSEPGLFAFDVFASGARLAAIQFQNCACSALKVLQDQSGRWSTVLDWTPLLQHDYRDDAELEAWHCLPVEMVRGSARQKERKG